MPIYKVDIRFNNQGLGSAQNVFWFESGAAAGEHSFILSAATSWIQTIYGPLRPFMDTGCSFASGRVLRVAEDGEVLEVIGSITPVIGGTNNSEGLALPTAGSSFARTNNAKVKGSKRWPGFVEGTQVDGLFTNAIVAAMAQAVAEWIGSFLIALFQATPGVLSTSEVTFLPFSGTGVVTNVPGTQVTRKPLRGQ